MKNLSIGKRIGLGFFLIIVAAAALGGFAVYELRGISQRTEGIATDNLRDIQCLQQARYLAQRNFGDSLNFLYTENVQVKERLDREIQARITEVGALLDKYRSTLLSEREVKQFDSLGGVRKTYVDGFN